MLSEATLATQDSRDSASKGGELRPGSAGAGASPAVAKSVLILFATETGASEDVAKALGRAVEQQGLASRVLDMADADVAELSSVDVALFVASTTGDGDAPYAAESYFAAICADDAAPLDHLSYAVLALGDATYEHFCAAGKRLDDALAQRGARRLLERVDCDIDYEEPAAAWRTAVLGSVSQQPLILPTDDAPRGPAAARSEKYRLTEATVVENRVLTGEGSTKATRHIALAFSDRSTAYEPGDALGVFVQNDPGVVTAVLAAGGFAPDVLVTLKGEQISLREALHLYLDITSVTPRFLESWAELAQSQALLEIAQASDPGVRATAMRQYHIVDIMREYPACALGAQTLVDMLRSLQPRLYSIASSLKAAPGQVHLTIAPVSYPLWGEVRRGVATGQLCERTAIGTRLQIYVQGNSHFRLPAPDTPIIMIGAGTGVAPYRGFLQERSAQGAGGRSWLFFGERNQSTDFLYEAEFAGFLATGALTHLDTAFSRDGTRKIYVQDRLLAQAEHLCRWLSDGAHIYVCGDAAHMAPDVDRALIRVLETGMGLDAASAGAYLGTMQAEGRYQRDVY